MDRQLTWRKSADDGDRYLNEYVPQVRPLLQKHGSEFVVAGPGAEPAEGEPPNSTVVIRFADTDAVWGFLNDPDYQPVKEIGLSSTSRTQMVVPPEYTPPQLTAPLRWPAGPPHADAGARLGRVGGRAPTEEGGTP